MKSDESPPISLRLRSDVRRAIENYRRQQPEIPSRTDAIDALLRKQLITEGYLPASAADADNGTG